MTRPSRLASWLLGLSLALLTTTANAYSVVRAVMNGDLRSLDPLWTIAPPSLKFCKG